MQIDQIYYCKTRKRYYWLVNYFHHSYINFADFKNLVEHFSRVTGLDKATIELDRVRDDGRFKDYCYLYSNLKYQYLNESDDNIEVISNFLEKANAEKD